MDLFVLVPIFGVIALLYTFLQSSWVNKQNAGNEKMKTIMATLQMVQWLF